jgi:predicted small secreted protein
MQTKSLIKGIGIGLVAGSILTAAVVPLDKKRIMRSKAGRTVRAIGQAVDGICGAFM